MNIIFTIQAALGDLETLFEKYFSKQKVFENHLKNKLLKSL